MRPALPYRRRNHWVATAAAVCMLLLQVVVAVAPLAEGREGPSMAAHVDGTGPNTHYTHDAATCPACQARTLQGSMAFVPPIRPVAVRHDGTVVTPLVAAPSAGYEFFPNPRAPPALT